MNHLTVKKIKILFAIMAHVIMKASEVKTVKIAELKIHGILSD